MILQEVASESSFCKYEQLFQEIIIHKALENEFFHIVECSCNAQYLITCIKD